MHVQVPRRARRERQHQDRCGQVGRREQRRRAHDGEHPVRDVLQTEDPHRSEALKTKLRTFVFCSRFPSVVSRVSSVWSVALSCCFVFLNFVAMYGYVVWVFWRVQVDGEASAPFNLGLPGAVRRGRMCGRFSSESDLKSGTGALLCVERAVAASRVAGKGACRTTGTYDVHV